MLIIGLFAKLAAYACIGWVIEVLFTGFYSLIKQKNKSAVSVTYLWMGPIYGLAGMVLELVQSSLTWPWYLKPIVYLPLIYGIEGLSGWAIRKITGRCPWEYEKSGCTLGGLIQPRYAPFWLLLGLCFGPICTLQEKLVMCILLE